MKSVVLIAFIVITSNLFGQQWRDSMDVARDAYKNEEFIKALKYYKSAQKNAPENIDLSDEMAQSAYKAREFKEAENIYRQNNTSKKTKQEQADNWYNLGNSKMKNRDYEGATNSYKESLRLNPNDNQARYNLSEAIRSLKEEQKKDKKQGAGEQNKTKKQNQQNQGQDGDRGNQEAENKGQLTSKTVEKMLDKLMKDEAETKRQVTGNDRSNKPNKSGKDW